MNCHEVADALDLRPLEFLGADLRRDIETHAERCDGCRRALEAESMLRADRVPTMPPLDVARLIAARREHASSVPSDDGARVPGGASARRAKRLLRPAVFAVLAAGGAAFAALMISSEPFGRMPADGGGAANRAPGSILDAEPAEQTAQPVAARPSLIDYVDAAEAAAADALRAEMMRSPAPPDGDMFALLKVAPTYPPRAAARGLEGYALVEFTVTPEGDVADPRIIESSDPIFEPPTLDAVRKAKYKPRVVDGRPIAAEGIRNRFSYTMEAPSEEGSRDGSPATEAAEAAGDLSFGEFRALLEPVLDCVERSDLLCVELALDEMRAIYALTPRQESELARIYGFVYHRLGDYERAISAYERAAQPFEDDPIEGTGNYFATPWMTVAMIHYERHRYQEALDAAIRYLRAAKDPSFADYVFVDRLRQLGAVVR